jgi:hypothetical protein
MICAILFSATTKVLLNGVRGDIINKEALHGFFLVWERVSMVQLDPTREDTMIWRWENDGCYSSCSAYKAFFSETTKAEGVD